MVERFLEQMPMSLVNKLLKFNVLYSYYYTKKLLGRALCTMPRKIKYLTGTIVIDRDHLEGLTLGPVSNPRKQESICM